MAMGMLLSTTCTGCVSWFLNGAREHSGGAPASAIARFTVPSCRTLADGSQIAGPQDQAYFLAQEAQGPVLYEVGLDGEGAAITNHWTDESGTTHFFVWVSGSHGWVYSFPGSREELPNRYVLAGGTYEVRQRPDGVSVPVGQPLAVCAMIPTGAAPPVQPPQQQQWQQPQQQPQQPQPQPNTQGQQPAQGWK